MRRRGLEGCEVYLRRSEGYKNGGSERYERRTERRSCCHVVFLRDELYIALSMHMHL